MTRRLMCDDGLRSGCVRQARWLVTTAGGELPLCAGHAEGYLRHGQTVYPRRRVDALAVIALGTDR